MKKPIYFITIFALVSIFLSCESGKNKTKKFEKFKLDKNLSKNKTFKVISKHPELKLYTSEKVESKTRTAYIIQIASYSAGLYHTKPVVFEDYKCSAQYEDDTLTVWLNNYNGYFGNGVLIKVFKNQFFIKDIDPKTLKGEIKFLNSFPVYQNLILNKWRFQRNDSIFGFIKYEAKIDSSVTKHFQGYFKTKIK